MEENIFHLPAKKYIKYFSGTTPIDLWKSSGNQKKMLKV